VIDQFDKEKILTWVELVERLSSGPHPVPRNSLAVILTVRHEFKRLAPGVWAMAGDAATLCPNTATNDKLLTPTACRAYSQARFAGLPRNAYPLWTPAMEFAWCCWAQHENERDLLDSLLVVAEPDTWPTTEIERQHWKNLAHRYGKYRLLKAPPPLHDCRPKLRGLFRAAWACRVFGATSWVHVNRIIGRHG